jgi:protein-S-isoprenylcysteine O-methyltransferase Ste14
MTTAPIRTPATHRPLIRWGRVLSQFQDATLVIVTLLFIAVHGRQLAAGHWSSMPFAVEQVVLVSLFLTRRRSRFTSNRWQDWVAATVGGWGPLALQVHEANAAWMGITGFTIQLAGLSLATVCFLGLGRSFGVVAANRGIKTAGPYSIVRHPIYACHFITSAGFIVANPHWINVAIVATVFVAQVFRMRAEERVLTQSGDYADYAAQVRWRILPGLY